MNVSASPLSASHVRHFAGAPGGPLTGVTIGGDLSHALAKSMVAKAPPPSHDDPAATTNRMLLRSRHSDATGAIAKAMFQHLPSNYLFVEDYTGPQRLSLLVTEASQTRDVRSLTKAQQVSRLREKGYDGPSLDDDHCIDVDSGETQKELVVNAAAGLLAKNLEGTAAAARMKNAYFHDGQAGGRLTKLQRHELLHRQGAIDQEMLACKLEKVTGPSLVFDKQTTRICANVQGTYRGSLAGTNDESADMLVQTHTMKTAQDFDTKRPQSVDDLKRRFHRTAHAAQHSMMVAGKSKLVLVLMEGPKPNRRGKGAPAAGVVRTAHLVLDACPEWQKRWRYNYDVVDGAMQLLWPRSLAMPITSTVTAFAARERQTYSRTKHHCNCPVHFTTKWFPEGFKPRFRLEDGQFATPCAGFYVAPNQPHAKKRTDHPPRPAIDGSGRLLHRGHLPGHHADSARQSSFVPELSDEQLLEAQKRQATAGVSLESIVQELNDSGTTMTTAELRTRLRGRGERLMEATLEEIADPVFAHLHRPEEVAFVGEVFRNEKCITMARCVRAWRRSLLHASGLQTAALQGRGRRPGC